MSGRSEHVGPRTDFSDNSAVSVAQTSFAGTTIVGGGGFQTTGLSIQVGAGQSYRILARLYMVSLNPAFLGGATFRLINPAATGRQCRTWYGPVAIVSNVSASTSFSSGGAASATFGNFNIDAGGGQPPASIELDATIDNFSASGLLDIQGQPVIGGDTFAFIGAVMQAFVIPAPP